MSFTGNLEDLAIVDVVQLLHTTKKSGTLCVRGTRGQGQLVFQDGLIISAKHPDNNLRTGDYLVAMNFITQDVLNEALEVQKNEGNPLIATLIEQGKINKEEAYKGLETLVDMTVVEMVRWTRGTFTLDVDSVEVHDEFTYFPDKMVLDTQMVLMDALRIYDEKNRDGEFDDDQNADTAITPQATFDPRQGQAEIFVTDEKTSPEKKPESQDLTLDDLGLSDFDSVEKQIPDVFTPLEAVDPNEGHRRAVLNALPDASTETQEQLVQFFAENAAPQKNVIETEKPSRTIVLLSRSPLLQYAIECLCSPGQTKVLITEDVQQNEDAVDQSLTQGLPPLVVIDRACGLTEAEIISTQRVLLNRFPQLPIIQIIAPTDYALGLDSQVNGVFTVLQRPISQDDSASFASDFQTALTTLKICIERGFYQQRQHSLELLSHYVSTIQNLTEARDISYSLLQTLAKRYERVLTLILNKSELVAERSIGISASAVQQLRIPLDKPSVFRAVVDQGDPLQSIQVTDGVLTEELYAAIGMPHCPDHLLLPIKNRGRTIALLYADHGSQTTEPLPMPQLNVLAKIASLALENSFYQKQLEKLKP